MDNNAPATDNPVDYIQHHLQPLAVGDGFWRINIDTMFFSILLAGIVMIVAYRVGYRLNNIRLGFVNECHGFNTS